MILAVIQARMSSSRLPGKVLLDIAGKPMLQWVVERARLAKTVGRVVVATTTDPADDPIAAFCEAQGYLFTRGSLHDVLDRYVQAARQFKADIVVRVTADCPLLDPGLLDETVELLLSRDLDFAANRLPPPWGRNYPIGLDVEVATMDAFERAWRETGEAHFREHVMPYFYDDLPPEPLATSDSETISTHAVHRSHFAARTSRGFNIALLVHAPDYGSLRWTVDTPQDLDAVRRLARWLPDPFTWLDVLNIWESHPEIAALNAGVAHKTSRDVEERK